MGYYYLGAQLPYLVYGQKPPMSSASFKAMAVEQMGADGRLMDFCTLDPDPAGDPRKATYYEPALPTPSVFINNWKEWERALRLNLAKNRAQKLERSGGSLVDAPAYPPGAALAAKTAMTMESPLEAEIFLDKARWEAIDSFQGLDVFCDDAMYAYLLKLLLMERRAAFIDEDGVNEYKGLYAAILGEVK